MRHKKRFKNDEPHEFQFTHPGKGATYRNYRRSPRVPCFNSRTLGRVRRFALTNFPPETLFQFTHPGKGATVPDLALLSTNWFQFTHPGKGATGRRTAHSTTASSFNSRTLGRVRRGSSAGAECFPPRVSIHAPWEGCDVSFEHKWGARSDRFNSRTLGRVRPASWELGAECLEFQFTHPGKGATGD